MWLTSDAGKLVNASERQPEHRLSVNTTIPREKEPKFGTRRRNHKVVNVSNKNFYVSLKSQGALIINGIGKQT